MNIRIVGRILNFLVAAGALFACRSPRPAGETVAQSPAGGHPDQVLGQFTMDAYNGLRRQWALSAPRGELFDREHRVDLVNPRVRFYNDGRPGSEVVAAQGRLNSETKDMWATGGLVMVSTDGVRLESEWAHYDKKTDRFVSTAPVTVTRGPSVVKGVGWQAQSDLSDMIIFSQRGEIAEEDSRGFGKR